MLERSIGEHTTLELKAAILTRLRAGWSRRMIRATLPTGWTTIRKLSKHIGASFLKRGRGRRFSPELREQIRAALRAGKRSRELQREFGVSYATSRKFRREMGDFENRKYWRKLTRAQIELATEALRSGQTWLAVARELGCALSTVIESVPYRKNSPHSYRNSSGRWARMNA